MPRNRALLACLVALGCAGEPKDTGEPTDPGEPIACPIPEGIPYTAPRPPNVMLVVDRSASMDSSSCGWGDCPTRWEQLLSLADYVSDVDQASRLGLTVFPGPGAGSSGDSSCSVEDAIVVPISEEAESASRILDQLESLSPGGRTPVADTLDLLREEGRLTDAVRDNVVILLTDGAPNCVCGGSDTSCEREAAVAAVERLVGGSVPVELFVVGFGWNAAGASETLQAMAAAAHRTTVEDNYYQVDTVEDLMARLYAVAEGLQSCDYQLDEPPAAADLAVWVGGELIAACTEPDCVVGYTYDEESGSVTLAPATCRSVAGQECPDVWFDGGR